MKKSFFLVAAHLLFIITQAQDNYDTVRIGNQTWMKKNLDVTKYRNGDPIPKVTDSVAWSKLTTGAWCYYNNDSANGKIYGKLYNWYAVNDSRGLAPKGWHTPSDSEWTTLSIFLGGEYLAGRKMKETSTNHWKSSTTDATNSSGFTGLPSGFRTNGGGFKYLGIIGYWWTSPNSEVNGGYIRFLSYLFYGGSYFSMDYTNKLCGFPIRCLKN